MWEIFTGKGQTSSVHCTKAHWSRIAGSQPKSIYCRKDITGFSFGKFSSHICSRIQTILRSQNFCCICTACSNPELNWMMLRVSRTGAKRACFEFLALPDSAGFTGRTFNERHFAVLPGISTDCRKNDWGCGNYRKTDRGAGDAVGILPVLTKNDYGAKTTAQLSSGCIQHFHSPVSGRSFFHGANV